MVVRRQTTQFYRNKVAFEYDISYLGLRALLMVATDLVHGQQSRKYIDWVK